MPAQPQTCHGSEPAFLDAADRFVQLANELNEKYSREWVGTAMLYAAARHNAFVWLAREANQDQTPDQATACYASEFDKMLRDNVDEIGPHYRASSPGGSAQN